MRWTSDFENCHECGRSIGPSAVFVYGQVCTLPVALPRPRTRVPRRFESRKTGKAGYALACTNEWVRGICEKPRIKCAECPHRRFLQVTDEVIRWHLSGHDAEGQRFVAGVYPLLQDETCFFLAVDFDKAGWHEDAQAGCNVMRAANQAEDSAESARATCPSLQPCARSPAISPRPRAPHPRSTRRDHASSTRSWHTRGNRPL